MSGDRRSLCRSCQLHQHSFQAKRLNILFGERARRSRVGIHEPIQPWHGLLGQAQSLEYRESHTISSESRTIATYSAGHALGKTTPVVSAPLPPAGVERSTVFT